MKTPVIYSYDGSLAGFYTGVFDSFYLKELPVAFHIVAQMDGKMGAQMGAPMGAPVGAPMGAPVGAQIYPQGTSQTDVKVQDQISFLDNRSIITDWDKAQRVRRSIPIKIGARALSLVERVFLSCLHEKEIKLLRFLIFAYKTGSKSLDSLGHPQVAPLIKAEKHLLNEAHLLKGFVRFADYEGMLAATISPKNYVLPFIADHFCRRFAREEFIIFDKTNKAALIYRQGKGEIISMDDFELPPFDEQEELYRRLWQDFYKQIAIKSKVNPQKVKGKIARRYWENMTENTGL